MHLLLQFCLACSMIAGCFTIARLPDCSVVKCAMSHCLDQYTPPNQCCPVCRPPNPVESATQCCDRKTTEVDLRNGGVSDGGVGKVIVKPEGTPASSAPCNLRALLKVTFEKQPSCITGCLTYPLCGRRMLRVDLELSSAERSGFLFNIGDSVSNDGYKGDYNDQTHDSEIDSIYPSVYVRPSDLCSNPSILATYADAVKSGSVNRVTIFISNEHVRIINDNGLNQMLCHKCLFALNGQADPSWGGVNEDIYIALNRVITGRSDRYGVGVCSAKLSWVCSEDYYM